MLQGERPLARDNKTIGRFMLDGILPAPRGVPQIEVTFDIDANGILNVSAKDKATGREQRITITASSGLSKEEVDRLVKEAQLHEAEDRARKEEIELRNQADTAAYQAEKLMRDIGDKVPADIKADIEARVQEVRSALAGQDVNAVRSALDALNQALQRAGSAVYGQPGPNGAPTGGQTGGQSEAGTVEGEYREV